MARFPLCELTKPQVRALAEQAGLPVADKKDSTGICFIAERNFDRFIARYLESAPGEIRTGSGQVIGRHRGLIHYPPGKRKRLVISRIRGLSEDPLYDFFKDMDNNRQEDQQDDNPHTMTSTSVTAKDTH